MHFTLEVKRGKITMTILSVVKFLAKFPNVSEWVRGEYIMSQSPRPITIKSGVEVPDKFRNT
jgi:hypothetical protein